MIISFGAFDPVFGIPDSDQDGRTDSRASTDDIASFHDLLGGDSDQESDDSICEQKIEHLGDLGLSIEDLQGIDMDHEAALQALHALQGIEKGTGIHWEEQGAGQQTVNKNEKVRRSKPALQQAPQNREFPSARALAPPPRPPRTRHAAPLAPDRKISAKTNSREAEAQSSVALIKDDKAGVQPKMVAGALKEQRRSDTAAPDVAPRGAAQKRAQGQGTASSADSSALAALAKAGEQHGEHCHSNLHSKKVDPMTSHEVRVVETIDLMRASGVVAKVSEVRSPSASTAQLERSYQCSSSWRTRHHGTMHPAPCIRRAAVTPSRAFILFISLSVTLSVSNSRMQASRLWLHGAGHLSCRRKGLYPPTHAHTKHAHLPS